MARSRLTSRSNGWRSISRGRRRWGSPGLVRTWRLTGSEATSPGAALFRRPLTQAVSKLRKDVHGGESCSTGGAVSESSCHCLPGHWSLKRRPFYMFFTPQRFDTAKTPSRPRQWARIAMRRVFRPRACRRPRRGRTADPMSPASAESPGPVPFAPGDADRR
jgi:hypothetical protein